MPASSIQANWSHNAGGCNCGGYFMKNKLIIDFLPPRICFFRLSNTYIKMIASTFFKKTFCNKELLFHLLSKTRFRPRNGDLCSVFEEPLKIGRWAIGGRCQRGIVPFSEPSTVALSCYCFLQLSKFIQRLCNYQETVWACAIPVLQGIC